MQQGSHSVAPSPPIIVLLPDPARLPSCRHLRTAENQGFSALGLARRTVVAAGRAGFSRIYFLARDRAAPPGVTAISGWSSLADAVALQPWPLIIAHAAILAEPDWLARLAETQTGPARWRRCRNKMILLAAICGRGCAGRAGRGKGPMT